MENKEITVIEGFTRKRESGGWDTYQIFVLAEALYLVKTTKSFGDHLTTLFSNVGDLLSLAGEKIRSGRESRSSRSWGEVFREFSKRSAAKDRQQLLDNLDAAAEEGTDVTKVAFRLIEEVAIKKGYVINGYSSVTFRYDGKEVVLRAKKRAALAQVAESLVAARGPIYISQRFF